MTLDDLTPELQAKVLECKTPEELIALAKAEGYELSEEQLKGIAGGWGEDSCTTFERCEDYTYDWC